jgi:hypothetical protein
MRRLLFLALVVGSFPAAPAAAQFPGFGGDANALVTSWYQRFLGRQPDLYAASWTAQLQAGTPPDAVLAGILGSQEYYDRSGNTPQGFVQRLFIDLTGRPPGRREFGFWVQRAATGDRQAVAQDVLSRYPGIWQGASPPDFDYRPPYFPPFFRR